MDPLQLSKFEYFLHSWAGQWFPDSRRGELERALVRAAEKYGFGNRYSDFLLHLEGQISDEDKHAIIQEVLVGETYFFRDSALWDALKDEILVKLAQDKYENRRLRIWSCGCSTGEEPYSVALYLQQYLPRIESWDIQILATDISEPSLAKAQAGVYGKRALRELDRKRWGKWFDYYENGVQIRDDIRNMVHFSQHNLSALDFPSLPISRIDILLCRNVLIYLDRDLVNKIICRFRDCLAPEGWLILAPTEVPIDPPPGMRIEQMKSGLITMRRAKMPESPKEEAVVCGPSFVSVSTKASVQTGQSSAGLRAVGVSPRLSSATSKLYSVGQVATTSDIAPTIVSVPATANAKLAQQLPGFPASLAAANNGLIAASNGLAAASSGLIAANNGLATASNGLATASDLGGISHDLPRSPLPSQQPSALRKLTEMLNSSKQGQRSSVKLAPLSTTAVASSVTVPSPHLATPTTVASSPLVTAPTVATPLASSLSEPPHLSMVTPVTSSSSGAHVGAEPTNEGGLMPTAHISESSQEEVSENDNLARARELVNRARAKADRGNLTEAIIYAVNSVEAAPTLVCSWLVLALIQEEMNRLDDALESLNKAAYLEPRLAVAHLQIARVKSRLGDANFTLSLANFNKLTRELQPNEILPESFGLYVREARSLAANLENRTHLRGTV